MLSSAQRNEAQQPSGVSFETIGRNGGIAVGIGPALPLRTSSTVGVPMSGPALTVVVLPRSGADVGVASIAPAWSVFGSGLLREDATAGFSGARLTGSVGVTASTARVIAPGATNTATVRDSQAYRRSSARTATVSAGSFRILRRQERRRRGGSRRSCRPVWLRSEANDTIPARSRDTGHIEIARSG